MADRRTNGTRTFFRGIRPDRRRFLQLTAGIIGFSAVTGAASEPVQGVSTNDNSWPMFGYDHTNMASVADETGPEKLQEVWSYETQFEVDSSPVVADGMVYIGSDDRHLYAIDSSTGELEWEFETEEEVGWSTPAVSGGTIFFHAMSEGLYAFDAETGAERWSVDSKWPGSSVTVKNGTVYYGHHHTLFARDAESGDKEWEFSADGRVMGAPAVVNGTVYCGTSTGNTVHAVDASTGEEDWQFEPFDSVWSSPTVYADTVFFGSDDGHLYALDSEDGTEQWRFAIEGTSVRSSPAVADGTVYFVGSRNLYAVDSSEGTEKWVFEELHALNSSPAIVGEILYVGGGGDGVVYAVDTETGNSIATFETGDTIWNSSPAVASETVFIGSYDHSIYALSNRHTYAIRAFDSPVEITQGEEITVTVTLENTGRGMGNQDVIFTVDGSQEETTTEEIGSGESIDLTFSYETDSETPSKVIVSVATDDDEATAEVTVMEADDEEDDSPEQNDEEESENDDTDTAGNDDSETEENNASDRDTNADSERPEDDTAADGDGIGFGMASAIAGLGGTVYILKRRLSGRDADR